MNNAFAKLKEKKEQEKAAKALPNLENVVLPDKKVDKPEKSKLNKPKNPFARAKRGETNSASLPPAKKVSNPFVKSAEKQQSSPPGDAAKGLSDVVKATCNADSPAISADEYIHIDQPEKYNEDQIRDLKNRLELLRNSFEHKDQITDAIKSVGLHLREHPSLCKIMSPISWGLMVRGMRESYGVVIQKKQERRGKKVAKAEDLKEAEDILSSLDGFTL